MSLTVDALWQDAEQLRAAERFEDARTRYLEVVERAQAEGHDLPTHLLVRLAEVARELGRADASVELLVAVQHRASKERATGLAVCATARMARAALGALEFASADGFLSRLEAWLPDLDALAGEDAAAAAAALERLAGLSRRRGEPSPLLDVADALATRWSATGRFTPAARVVSRMMQLEGLPTADLLRLASTLADLQLNRGALGELTSLEAFARSLCQELGWSWSILAARRARLMGRFSDSLLTLGSPDLSRAPTRARTCWALERAHTLVLLNRSGEAIQAITGAMDLATAAAPNGLDVELLRGALEILAGRTAWAVQKTALPPPPEFFFDGTQVGEPRPIVGDFGARKDRTFLDFSAEWAARARRAMQDTTAPCDPAATMRPLAELLAQCDSPYFLARGRYFRSLFALRAGRAGDCILDAEGALDTAVAQGWRYDERQLRRVRSLGLALAKRTLEADDEVQRLHALDAELVERMAPLDAVTYRFNKASSESDFVASRVAQLEALEATADRARWAPARWLLGQRARRKRIDLLRAVAVLTGWALPQIRENSSNDVRSPVQLEMEVRRALASGPPLRARRGSLTDRLLWLWRLPKDLAILHYYSLPDRILGLLVTRGRVRLVAHDASKEALYDALRYALSERLRSRRAGRARLRDLAECIGFPDVMGRVPAQVSRLVVVPHDLLAAVPYSALPIGDDSWVCQRAAVSIVPALRDLRAGDVPPLLRGPWLGAGVRRPVDPDLRPLEGAVREIHMVESLAGESGILLEDGQATPERVVKALGEVRWAHIACHGVLVPEDFGSSHLCLAASENTPSGRLTLATLAGLNARGLDAAVFAACWMAGGFVLPGNQLVSLPSAILAAGARCVLAPLWQVDDLWRSQKGSRYLASEFLLDVYRHAKNHGLVHGLSMAQAEWATSDDDVKAAPHQWASYQAYGGA